MNCSKGKGCHLRSTYVEQVRHVIELAYNMKQATDEGRGKKTYKAVTILQSFFIPLKDLYYNRQRKFANLSVAQVSLLFRRF